MSESNWWDNYPNLIAGWQRAEERAAGDSNEESLREAFIKERAERIREILSDLSDEEFDECYNSIPEKIRMPLPEDLHQRYYNESNKDYE